MDDRLTALSLTLVMKHYVWAAGHFLLLFCAVKYLLAWVTFQSVGQSRLYSCACANVLLRKPRLMPVQ